MRSAPASRWRARARINALFVETKAGRQAIRADIFIDCSGDGDLAAWAGAPFEVGDSHGHMLYPSMMFRLNGIDPAKAGDAWRTIPQLMEQAEAKGTHKFPRKAAIVRPQRSQIEWRVNFTQLKRSDGSAINGLEPDDLTRGEIDGRRQARRRLRLPAHGARLRKILHRRSAAAARHPRDAARGRRLSALGRGRARLRLVRGFHRRQWLADGGACRGRRDLQFPPIPESRGYNELPYRMLVPEKIDNLLVAGRCASMTHEGQSAARVSGACFAMGEAAGTAAALALRGNRVPRDIAIEGLQAALKEQGAFIGRDQAVPEGL